MSLEKIITITGKPGLYEIIAQSNKGFVVESVGEKKKFSISASHQVSALNDIAIYTYEGEFPLRLIFKAIAEKNDSKETISHKSTDKELKAFLTEFVADYDAERVYASNIKKVVQWYNILAKSEFDFSAIKTEEEMAEEENKAKAAE